jgi:hypothetical protein
MPGRLREF